jgi:leucyl aminopeptidase
MQINLKTSDPAEAAADLLMLPLAQSASSASDKDKKAAPRLPAAVRRMDRVFGGVIAAALASGDFKGTSGQTALLYPAGEGPVKRVLLFGLGSQAKVTAETLRRAAGSAVRQAGSGKRKRVSIWLPRVKGIDAVQAAQTVAEGAVLGTYRFDDYRNLEEGDPGSVRSVSVFPSRTPSGAKDVAAIKRAISAGRVIAEAQNVARDLSNTPGNDLAPAQLASEARRVAREVGLRCQVMTAAELERRKMGGILAVGGGSSRPPRLIVLEHKPARKSGAPTICIVGKGVTFDSGGISIKPSAGMEEMKHDMSGAAAVVGAMRAVAQLKLPLHVVAVIGAAENLPSGTAYRPGDVVRTASGKTIEVLNTDAEGRVVLADALHHAHTTFEPEAMIDLATLTGACMVALGEAATGLFGNDDDLIERVRAAGDRSGECAWPMPLFDAHRTAVKSTIADVKNSAGREAGASTAAAFLEAFTGDTPWVHLDIAGTGWTSNTNPCQIKGATGVGVRMLLELLRSW